MRLTLLIALSTALSAQGATINAASCSRADVGTAVAAATYDDTVTVPAGECTWTTSLTIAKGMTLTGAGVGSTIITANLSTNGMMLIYEPDATSRTNDSRFELAGFTFDLGSGGDGGFRVNNTGTQPITTIVVRDNEFKNQTQISTSVACLWITNAYGLAHSNTFTDCKVIARHYAKHVETWDNTTFEYGGSSNFYMEDNTFTGNSAFHFGGQGGRYVARFNNYTFTTGSYEVVWDIHGNQTSGVASTMGCEIHHNTVSLARSTMVVDHRGGSCMIFANATTGTSGGWQIREEFDDSIVPTTNSQPQHVSNSYYFLNTHGGVQQNLTETQDCCDAIAENAQYWNQSASFDGTVGVGTGTLASRPATCTAGVAYWATDQGAWNKLPSGEQGQLYKCASTNTWELYYTPYEYPHPLQGYQPGRRPLQGSATITGGARVQ